MREAKARKEKEEKKRLKREKAEAARRAEEEKTRQAATAQGGDDSQDGRPSKRRRLTPERPADQQQAKGGGGSGAGPRLLRFQAGGGGGGFGRSDSVEKYDKLNDIEEGAYGWVARAKEIATGEVVALKRLKIEPNDRNGLPVTGLREIQILKDCEHRNIVKLREVVVGEDTAKIEKCVIRADPFFFFAPVPK